MTAFLTFPSCACSFPSFACGFVCSHVWVVLSNQRLFISVRYGSSCRPKPPATLWTRFLMLLLHLLLSYACGVFHLSNFPFCKKGQRFSVLLLHLLLNYACGTCARVHTARRDNSMALPGRGACRLTLALRVRRAQQAMQVQWRQTHAVVHALLWREGTTGASSDAAPRLEPAQGNLRVDESTANPSLPPVLNRSANRPLGCEACLQLALNPSMAGQRSHLKSQ